MSRYGRSVMDASKEHGNAGLTMPRQYRVGPPLHAPIYEDDGHAAHLEDVFAASGGKGFPVLNIQPTYRVRS